MSSPYYFNGPANTQYAEDLFITHCLILCFLLLCALPLTIHFKSSIWWTFTCIEDIIKHTYFCIAYIFKTSYGLHILCKEIKQIQSQDQHHQQVKTDYLLIQISQPPEELLIEVREQLIQPPFPEQISPLQDLQQNSQVFDTEHSLNLHTPNISRERTYSPPVIFNGKERCLNFVNQDLTFLQPSDILST